MTGIVGMLVNNVLPLAGGFAGGLIIPKVFLKTVTNDMVKMLIVAGIGVAVPVVLGRFIGRKTAVLIGTGVMASVVVRLLDKLIVKDSPAVGGPLLADDSESVELMAEGDMVSAEDPAVVGADDPAVVGAEDYDGSDGY
jgi:hypothetical protein